VPSCLLFAELFFRSQIAIIGIEQLVVTLNQKGIVSKEGNEKNNASENVLG
jgi:hypothetical protein